MLKTKLMTTSVLLIVLFGPANAAVRKGPYLIYVGLNTAMTVLWQLDSTQDCTIHWGVDDPPTGGTAGTVEYGNGDYGHQHSYTIADLTPGTKYVYQVACDLDSVGSGTFYTAPANDEEDVKFMVYGDTRSYPADHDSVNSQMIDSYTKDQGYYQTVTLHVGDWVTDGDVEDYWDFEFFDSVNYTNTYKFQANMPINGVRGNHEGNGLLFEKYFPYPYTGDTGSFYWSFDYGPAHIAVVDQYVEYNPDSTQHTWLKEDLSSSTKKWKFIVLHEPGWSAGSHENNVDVQNYIQPLAVVHGVDIIFAGHNHNYARAVVEGVQHVTTGGGGAPLYAPNPDAEHVVAAAELHHFGEVDIQGNELIFTARDVNGKVLDSFAMNHLFTTSLADSDIPVSGSVSGSYTATHELDGSMETITERSSGGKPSKRTSYLEHKWTFQIKAGALVTLFAEVSASSSDDGDAFEFAWSTDDVTYTTMFTVNDTSASAQSFILEPTTSETVYVRVVDTDRSAGTGNSLDSVSVDQIFIRTDTAQGDPPAAPGTLTATAISMSEISLSWEDVTDEIGFRVEQLIGSNWVSIASLGADVRSYTDGDLQPGTEYSYRVKAFNAAGSSPPSNEASATTEEGSVITLTASGYKVKGVKMADLTWNGANGTNVNIKRNGVPLITTLNDGSYADNIGRKGESSYLYEICETGTDSNCSNEAAVSF